MRVARRTICFVILGICLAIAGCHHFAHRSAPIADVPRENNKGSNGDYIIFPPDVLVIDLVRAVPLPPYRIKPQDLLFVQVAGTPPEDPIKGVFRVEPEGNIRLGVAYGSVPVAELSVDEAIRDVEKHLKKFLKEPKVSVSLEETRGVQLVRGEHLVRPDGTVNLGLYGRVSVAGMTQEMAKQAIEGKLAEYFLKPQITLDISGFNSGVYYIIFDGGGIGEQVIRLPHTGSETVLDAIGQVSGLPGVASKNRVWLARPDNEQAKNEIMPIDWKAITQHGQTATNYQIFPGDRIYVAAQPLIIADNFLARAFAPIERIFGIVLLGSGTVQSLSGGNNGNNGGGFGGGF